MVDGDIAVFILDLKEVELFPETVIQWSVLTMTLLVMVMEYGVIQIEYQVVLALVAIAVDLYLIRSYISN
jgi:hypothetical protein